jgi:uncharacterized protein (TIGR00251 family)
VIERRSDGSLILSIIVSPNAPQTEIVGLFNSALKVKIHAPPVDGKANEEVVRFFAELLELPQRSVKIHSGETSKSKRIRIVGKTEQQLINAVTVAEP